ncbi:ABC transporter substrate-binding protein [Moraxella catarrhalis]|uniref:ABC transporter substrate-binding protein n=1 Tax=Moraxella catarrhalis TaxID=480 RepID=A0A198UFY0_MORCA|nr:ABC transporter substrate-binding protein [Moraxella catarrhalis]OAU95234.1 ABC transporter substrate-binding protein [Moraxella catarrhalis]OAU99810.1 ABC transporter substrate-binding protein [Moraxella catarrhalis]OAV01508.1 ABC transporter substrate-binding protein [Moraxella catarrhalis]
MNKFLKTTLWASLAALTLTACGGDKPAAQADSAATEAKTVAITAIVEHPALDAARQGALDQLAEEGFKEGENLTVNFQSAQGNMGTAGQIARQFTSDNPDIIYAIATPSAQAIAAATQDIPVVFSAVTDPVEAKLVGSLESSGNNITGASDALPYEPQIALIQELVPNVKNVGYVYSPGEVNSTVVLRTLKEKLAPLGINVIEAPAQKSSDITQAANSLVGRVDVIYTSTDNNVINAYEALYQVAKEAKIPLISADTSTVERGAVAALGVNYTDLGKESGKIIARILKGEKPADIPVYISENLDLYVSKKHAAEQGVTLPQAVLDRAAKVVE